MKSDSTPTFKRKLAKLEKEDKITHEQYLHLYPTSDMIPRLYNSLKIHKKGTLLMPIVNYTGSMAYSLSRALANLLKPLVGKMECFVKNTTSFTMDIRDIRREEYEIMNLHDMVCLFTNVPIKEALEVIGRHLREDETLSEHIRLAPEDILDLLEFVLSTTYFMFDRKIYSRY